MQNKYNKIAVITAIIMDTVLIFSAVTSIKQNNLDILYIYLLAIVCIVLPFIISYAANKRNIFLPNSFNLVSILFIFSAHYFGEIHNFYNIYWWWDLLLHSVFGSYAVIVSLHIIEGVIKRKNETPKNRYILFLIIFAFSISIALGTLWEMFEFSGDYFLKTSMIKGGLEDTSTDLLVKITAALITSAYYYFKLKKSDNL